MEFNEHVYWAETLGSINGALVVLTIMSAATVGASTVASFEGNDVVRQLAHRVLFVAVTALIFCATFLVFVPSEDVYRRAYGLPQSQHTHTCDCPIVLEFQDHNVGVFR